jgi:uncharacterized protein (DUF2345 family)
MKNKNHYFITILFSLIFPCCLLAQSSTSATASATILTAISITKVVDMNFGNVSVQAQTGGTVILSTGGIRSATGGVTLPATGGTVTAAAFTVSGAAMYSYSITLPQTPFIIALSSKVATTMTVTAFLSTPSITGMLTGGSQNLTVGATLNIAAGQAAGLYTSTTGFPVTVNYN